MKCLLRLNSLIITVTATVNLNAKISEDSITHFFWLPLDTSIAYPAPAIETKDSSGIYIVDVAFGKGELSDPKRRHFIRFIGTRAATMEYFSTEFAGNRVFAFIPDSTNVIPGLKYALRGMRVGGRRRVVIPSHLAYGIRGNPAYKIGPNETIILDIELLKIEP
ncbi:MAG: FKBP-type peptidyl-prolyl cis-trans isomerase [Bacteroidota bacterium]|nr:FKBP-type peptidyl-prolyl cis-trans isomerase [Candidatus Kapabacteria bacterium]MDW8074515.1 FKBP-type peptidyl-prolyl cis-trans isomerase [Bacteroidota bacterium]